MAEDQDQSQKTEEPTQKRLEDARKKGQIPTSREINSFFMLLAFAMIAVWMMPGLMRDTFRALMPYIESAEDYSLDSGSFQLLLAQTAGQMGLLIFLPFLISIAAALGAGLLQSRINFSWDPLMPSLDKISPIKGFQRLFSLRSAVEFLKGVIKITVVGVVAALAIMPHMDEIPRLANMELVDVLAFLGMLVKRMLIGVLIIMFLIAILDYLYQYFEYIKNLRMTKQEIKDEYKQQEGDPHVKQKLRAIRRERAKKRMLAEVPKSDVVITNPTHFAVALKYDHETMAVPVLIAKGSDKVAFRIREIAEENKIIVMRNPPLARTLFDNVDIDDTIPYEYYKAVAEIISYVYRLKGKTLPRIGEAKQELMMPDKKKKKK